MPAVEGQAEPGSRPGWTPARAARAAEGRREGGRRSSRGRPAEHQRPFEGRTLGEGRREPGLGGSWPNAQWRFELCPRSERRREQEEGQARCQEYIAHRRDVPDHRERDRDDVAEGAEVEQEVGVELRRQDDVDRRLDVRRLEAGHLEARLPDRHVAAVHQDHDGVRQDADERDAETRVRAVGPQAGQQGPERGGEQRDPQRLDDVDAGRQRRFGQEADDHRQREGPDPAEANRGEVRQRATGCHAEEQADEDAEGQHEAFIVPSR